MMRGGIHLSSNYLTQDDPAEQTSVRAKDREGQPTGLDTKIMMMMIWNSIEFDTVSR